MPVPSAKSGQLPDNRAIDDALRAGLERYAPPSFPTVIARALATLNNPRANLGEVGKVLAVEPRVTIKLLSLANSPIFAFRTPVLSVEHAVALLGRSRLESLLLSMGVRGVLPRDPALDVERFWRAAARRATVARSVCERTDPTHAATCFTAALLQDMAIPFLLEQKREGYLPLLTEWREGGSDLAVLENESFGFNHAEIGGLLCESWGFPELMTAAIGTHHRSRRRYSSVPPPSVQLVACLREIEQPQGEEEFVETGALNTGLSTDALRDLLAEAEQEAHVVAQLYR